MKHLLLIYDDNCPLCSWYSGLFVKYGMLSAKGRLAYSTLDPEVLSMIDHDRARNHIALIDNESKTVYYGVESLLNILGSRYNWIKKAGSNNLIKWCANKLYKLISYNRKVIVAKRCNPGSIDCSPDMNYFYRTLFMMLCLTFNTLYLIPIHELVFVDLSYYSLSLVELQVAHFTLVFCNCILSLYFPRYKRYEYLGQVNMLALTVILMLIPLSIIYSIIPFSETLTTIYLALTALFIFKEYIRRMEYVGLISNNKWIVSFNLGCLVAFISVLFKF